jgi:Spy/CpxP family protein refolding chaperone
VRLRTFRFPWMLAMTVAVGVHAAGAQPRRGPGEMPPGEFELRHELIPPELVMQHQAEIGLNEEQKTALVHEMQALQSDLVPLQFEMSDAAGKLRAALATPRVDEEKAGVLADRLMSLETRIKRRHLALMIRIKNILTPEQQDRLRGLREEQGGERGESGRRPRAPGGAGRRSPGGPLP